MTCSATRTAGRTVFAGPDVAKTERRTRVRTVGRPKAVGRPDQVGRSDHMECPKPLHLEPQTTRKKLMFTQTTISYLKDFNCHIGTTICFWLGLGFQVGSFFWQSHPTSVPVRPEHRRGAWDTHMSWCGARFRSVRKIGGAPNHVTIHGPLEDEPHHPTPCDYFDLSSHVGVEWVDRFVVGATRWPSSLGVTHELAKTAG